MNFGDVYFVYQEVVYFFGFVGVGFLFDVGVDVFGVFMEDYYVDVFGVFDGVWYVVEVLYWVYVGVQVEFLFECYVDVVDVSVDWSGQWVFDVEEVVVECGQCFLWQLFVGVVDFQ